MADSGTDDRTAALDSLIESGLLAERRPIAAFPVRKPNRPDQMAVVCDDGAAYVRRMDGWAEVEPVPGTPRALMLEAER